MIDGSTIHATILSIQTGSALASPVQTPSSVPRLTQWSDIVVEYASIETPAPGDPFGPEATAANEALVQARIVYLELDATPWSASGDHLLAYVYLDTAGDVMVNALLVAQGIADARSDGVNVRYDDVFASLAQAAKQTCLGKNMLFSPCLPPDVLLQSDSGKTIILGGGSQLVVQLTGIPTTGYNWERTGSFSGSVLVPIEEGTFKADVAWVEGSPGTFTFRYQAASSGTTPLTLSYERPGGEDVLNTFSITVIVR